MDQNKPDRTGLILFVIAGSVFIAYLSFFCWTSLRRQPPQPVSGGVADYHARNCDPTTVSVNPNTTTTVLAGFSGRQWALVQNMGSAPVWLGQSISTTVIGTGFVINTATPQFLINLSQPYVGPLYGVSVATTSLAVNQCY